jgi:hypothetical protein
VPIPLDPTWDNSVIVTRPDDTAVEDTTLVAVTAATGLTYWEGTMDAGARGTWSAEGRIVEPGKDPYKSDSAYRRVE